MNWGDIKNAIGKAAPIAGSLIGGKAGEAVGGMVASALGVENTPEAVDNALKNDPEAMIKLQAMEQEHAREMRSMLLESETAKLSEVNKTMRAEAAANDAFVRRWRPTFGYAVAVTWVMQSGAIAWAMVGSPENASSIINATTALTPMWGIALAVLGVNVHKRSQDKQVQAGQTPSGLLGMLKR